MDLSVFPLAAQVVAEVGCGAGLSLAMRDDGRERRAVCAINLR